MAPGVQNNTSNEKPPAGCNISSRCEVLGVER